MSEKEIQIELERDLVSFVVNKPIKGNLNTNVKGSYLGNDNSRVSDGGHNSNAKFMFNRVEKWRSLGNRGQGSNVAKNVVDINSGNVIVDEVIKENMGSRGFSSFVNAIQGGEYGLEYDFSRIFFRLIMSHREIFGHLKECEGRFICMRITSMIGNPIIMDRIITSMCEKSYRRLCFERVLVEVDAEIGMSKKIKVCYKKLGRVEKWRSLGNRGQGSNVAKNVVDINSGNVIVDEVIKENMGSRGFSSFVNA
nr:zinc knuckle CX2CX4HX4C [Tanacetum cinerariifolium]